MFSGEKRPRLNKYISKAKQLLPRHIYTHLHREQLAEGPRKTPGHMLDDQLVLNRATETAQVYKKNIQEMQKLAQSYGFKLYLILQPTIFSGEYALKTEDLELTLNLAREKMPAIDKAFAVGYPLLRQALTEMASPSCFVFDASQIFDAKQDNIFLDFCHVNSIANRIIAQFIFTAIGGVPE